MRMINPHIIKKYLKDDGVYECGSNLFMEEHVGRIEIAKEPIGAVGIRAKVKGSRGNMYNTEIVVLFLQDSEQILKYHCDCEAYKNHTCLLYTSDAADER